MSYKRHKDLTQCLSRFKLKIYTPWYIHVYIWLDRESMYQAINGQEENNYAATYVPMPYILYIGDDWQIPETRNKIGELHIPIQLIGAGIVAHELLHFLFDWIEKCGMDIEEDEEQLCLLFGNITTEFWRIYYDIFKR